MWHIKKCQIAWILNIKNVSILVLVRLINCCSLMFLVYKKRLLLSRQILKYLLTDSKQTCILWTARDLQKHTLFNLEK